MHRRFAPIAAAVVLLAGVSVGLAGKDKPAKHGRKDKAAKTMVGQTAPDFSLTDLDGKTQALKDFKGKIVVLEWANPGCPIWKAKLDTLEKTYQATQKMKDVAWLAIDSTYGMTSDNYAKLTKKKEVTRSVLADADGKVGHAYDARTTPHMFIIDKDGKVAYDGAIDNAPPMRGEQPTDKDYVNYVTKALEELSAGKTVSTATTAPYGCTVKYNKDKHGKKV